MRRVIVDVDVGTDDAWAILLLLKCEKRYNYKVEAITCTHGNTDVEHGARNVLRVLTAINRLDIPVYKGATEPIVTPTPVREKPFHGVDGFADLVLKDEIDKSLIQRDHAVNELRRRILENPGGMSLIFIGPLTNLALCVKLYPETRGQIRDLYVMGGNRYGMGNVTKSAEFNFWADPEAAHIVFNNLPCPITLLPWETCLSEQKTIPMEWRMKIVGDTSNRAVQLLNQAEGKIFAGRPFWRPCDAFLAAVFIDPDIVVKAENFHVDIELTGSLTRGQMVLDHLKSKVENVKLVDKIKNEQFKLLMLYAADHDVEHQL
ncbi:pyrimidine-specific ribonucleoside hydrolase RihA-like [Sabethes cyaneus]|uniref:pyrimidine-specific ribonucleoside hydrolase RihA-like n=1 Tax=Sabethes cyaneus TaxID=53552 RepID=UPI00237DBC9E|nr:pyrimidine-specific ribonucleoside hydrolase RihA-like [Sabethes cyaneus]